MTEKQTIDGFLSNPMGSGSSAVMGRNLILSNLQTRYRDLVSRKTDLFKHHVYKDKSGEYYVHVTIPSETERMNTYDVVIRFMKPQVGGELADNSRTLNDYELEFFSNSPSFTFTFAHSFKTHGFLIELLKDKYRDEVLSSAPVIRNPSEIVSYEKSIVFTLLHIQEKRLNVREVLDKEAKKFDKDDLVKSIRNDDKIKMEIGKAKAELRKEHSRKEDKKAAINNKARNSSSGKVRNKISGVKTAKKPVTKKGAKPKR